MSVTHSVNCLTCEWSRPTTCPFFFQPDPRVQCAMLDNEELAGLKINQRQLKRSLKDKYGSWTQAPIKEQSKVKNLYLDYRMAERALYKKVSNFITCSTSTDKQYPKKEVLEYLEKHIERRSAGHLVKGPWSNCISDLDASPGSTEARHRSSNHRSITLPDPSPADWSFAHQSPDCLQEKARDQ